MRNESRAPGDFFLIKFVTRPARGYQRARENFSSRHDVHKSSAGRVDVRLWKVKICIGAYTGILNCSIRNDVPDWILCRCCTAAMIYYQSVRVLRVIYARCPTTTTATAHSFHKSTSNFTEQFDADLQNDRPLGLKEAFNFQSARFRKPRAPLIDSYISSGCILIVVTSTYIYIYILDVDYSFIILHYLILHYWIFNGEEHFYGW